MLARVAVTTWGASSNPSGEAALRPELPLSRGRGRPIDLRMDPTESFKLKRNLGGSTGDLNMIERFVSRHGRNRS